MSSYDQNLLDEAPKATRAQLQEGYNVDLLEPQPPRRTPSARNPPPQPPPVAVPLTPGVVDTGSGEKLGSAAYTPAAPKPKTSFWRTRTGIILVIVIALVVVGAVVGGAVGGTVKKTNNTVATTGTKSGSSVSGITAVSTTSENQGIGAKATSGTSPSPTSTTQAGQNAGGQVVGH